jgi:hypothetical protein
VEEEYITMKLTAWKADESRSQEIFLGGQLDIFNMGDLNIYTYLFMYPGISERGRFRSDFKFDIKYDLPLEDIPLTTIINQSKAPLKPIISYRRL